MNVETKPTPLLHPSSILRLRAVVNQPKQTVLLSGSPNIGKLEAAKWLAEQIVGPRWHTQALMIDSGEKGNISIESIQQIRHFTQYRSSGADDRKVVIIDNAHTMSQEAQNSFLKLLEEPPADVYMIMLSWQPSKLLQTIRSRLVMINLQSATYEQMCQHFENDDPQLIKKLYLMTGGSSRLIAEMLSDREHSYTGLIQQAKTLIGQSAYERLLRVDELAKDKPATEELLSATTTVLMSVLNGTAEQGKSIKSILPKLEAVLTARTGLRKNHNTKLTLTLLFCSL